MIKRQEAARPGEFPTTKSTSILCYPKLGEKQFLPCSAFGIIDHNQTKPPPTKKKNKRTKEQKELALQSERWSTTQPTS